MKIFSLTITTILCSLILFLSMNGVALAIGGGGGPGGLSLPIVTGTVNAFLDFIMHTLAPLVAVCALIGAGMALSSGGEVHEGVKKIAVLCVVIAVIMTATSIIGTMKGMPL